MAVVVVVVLVMPVMVVVLVVVMVVAQLVVIVWGGGGRWAMRHTAAGALAQCHGDGVSWQQRLTRTLRAVGAAKTGSNLNTTRQPGGSTHPAAPAMHLPLPGAGVGAGLGWDWR